MRLQGTSLDHNSQNVCKKMKLFIISFALNGKHVNTGPFIIHCLVEVAKKICCNVIYMGGSIITIAQGLNYVRTLESLEPHFLGGSIKLTTLGHLSIIHTKGGSNKYSNHKQIICSFSNVGHIIIANKKIWTWYEVVYNEEAMDQKSDEGLKMKMRKNVMWQAMRGVRHKWRMSEYDNLNSNNPHLKGVVLFYWLLYLLILPSFNLLNL